MAYPEKKKATLSTPRGEVFLEPFCSPEEIESLSFPGSETKYSHYRRLVSDKKRLVRSASQPDANVTLAFTRDGEIFGFGILEYPSPDERWARVGEHVLMEVSVIEVSRGWRSLGISNEILRLLMDHPLREDRIVYMVGYSWTWDLDDRIISAMAYRNMLTSIFSKQGFRTFQTNEPNVMLRPENLFMARIGKHVSEEIQRRFKLVRFDLDRYV